MIQALLTSLGFTTKETEVYLTVLEAGKIAPADIAVQTGINRTTVYSTAKELVKKGLVYEEAENGTTYLLARPPKNIQLLVARERAQLKHKEDIALQAIEELATFTTGQRYSIPRLRFIDEQELGSFFREQAPVWDESIIRTDGIWWGFQEQGFVEHFADWIDWYWKQAPPELILQLLSNDSQAEAQLQQRNYPNRHIRYWEGSEFTSSVWICGDYIIFLSTTTRPFYAIEIRDRMIAENMRAIFRSLWNTITPIPIPLSRAE